jgi:hypothetical protein
MKLHDCPEADSLTIELKPQPSAEVREVADGLRVDIETVGEEVRFDLDHAPQRFDLPTLETVALPLMATRAA